MDNQNTVVAASKIIVIYCNFFFFFMPVAFLVLFALQSSNDAQNFCVYICI